MDRISLSWDLRVVRSVITRPISLLALFKLSGFDVVLRNGGVVWCRVGEVWFRYEDVREGLRAVVDVGVPVPEDTDFTDEKSSCPRPERRAADWASRRD